MGFGAFWLAFLAGRDPAVAAGENDEDVAGPVPWTEDRSLRFALFATHPSVENRVARLGCEPPTRAEPRSLDRSRRPRLRRE